VTAPTRRDVSVLSFVINYKAALSVVYGAGLRVSEVVALKLSDIDSKRMLLRVEQGKGARIGTRRCLHNCSTCCATAIALRGPPRRVADRVRT
jgi:site-specific recombinase XerD